MKLWMTTGQQSGQVRTVGELNKLSVAFVLQLFKCNKKKMIEKKKISWVSVKMLYLKGASITDSD